MPAKKPDEATEAESAKAEKADVEIVLTVPTQGARRGDSLTVTAGVAARLVANNQANLA